MKTSPLHPLNVGYLVIGLVFLGISGAWALHAAGVVDNADVRWLVPLVLVGAGLVGLVAFAAKGVRGGRSEDRLDAPTDERYDQPYDGGIPPYAPVLGPQPVAASPTGDHAGTPDPSTDPSTDPSAEPTTRLDLTEGDQR